MNDPDFYERPGPGCALALLISAILWAMIAAALLWWLR